MYRPATGQNPAVDTAGPLGLVGLLLLGRAGGLSGPNYLHPKHHDRADWASCRPSGAPTKTAPRTERKCAITQRMY